MTEEKPKIKRKYIRKPQPPKPPKTEKKCTQCKTVKPIEDFYVCKHGKKSVHKSECKECTCKRNSMLAKKKKYKRKPLNYPKYQEYQRQYYLNNKDKFKSYRKNYLKKNPDYFKQRYQRRKAVRETVSDALREGDIY